MNGAPKHKTQNKSEQIDPYRCPRCNSAWESFNLNGSSQYTKYSEFGNIKLKNKLCPECSRNKKFIYIPEDIMEQSYK